MRNKLNRNKIIRAVVIEFTDNTTEESLKTVCDTVRNKTGYYLNYIYEGV